MSRPGPLPSSQARGATASLGAARIGTGESLPPEGEPRRSRWGAFQHRDFALLWWGLFVSHVGSWMQSVAQGWLMYELTESALALGGVSVVRVFAATACLAIGGTLADRFNRVVILFLGQVAIILASGSLGLLVATRLIEPWHIIAVAFFESVAFAFFTPARMAMVPDLVPRRDLVSATSLNSMNYQAAGLIGPSLAGLMIPIIGLDGAFFANCVAHVAIMLPLVVIRIPAVSRAVGGRPSFVAETVEGARYLRGAPVILALVGLTALSTFFGRAYQPLLPVLAKDVLGTDVTGLGWMTAAPGAGTVGGAILLGLLGAERKGLLILATGTLMGVSLGLAALSEWLVVTIAILFFSGFASSVYGALTGTLIQIMSPDEYRGRAQSLNLVAYQTVGPLGTVAMSLVTAIGGVPLALALWGVALLALLYAAYGRFAYLRELD